MIDQDFIKSIQNGGNIYHLFEIKTYNNVFYFTTADIDITFENNKYLQGYIYNNIIIAGLDDVDKINMQILKNNLCPNEELLNAKITIKILVNNNKSATIFRGFIKEISIDESIINCIILSNLALLNMSLGQLFSPLCRECFGSEKCKVDILNHRFNGKITEIVSNDCFIGTHHISNQKVVGYYKYGLVKFITGQLRGISMQIKDEENGKIYLLRNTKLLNIGDEYYIFAGCDKTLYTCKNKFNNVVNFRGEPYINKDI